MRNTLVMLGAALAIFVTAQLGALDIWLSDQAYDFELGTWAIDHVDSIWRPFLYEGPKVLIIVLGLALLTSIVRPTWLVKLRLSRREAVFLFLCLATVPAVVGQVRYHSGVSCPRALQRYGGDIEDHYGHVEVSRWLQEARPGGCWPSGHASGGFALLSLAFLSRTRRTRFQFAALGLGAGGAMGVYQILRGAHFASHIVITMLVALLLIKGLRLVVPKLDRGV